MVPADGPDRIGGGVLVACDAAGAGDFGELIAANDRPLVGLAIPFGQRATRDVGILLSFGAVLAIVRVHHPALARVEAFAVIAGEVRMPAGFDLLISPQLLH